jgi:hypothetical protein
VFAVNLSATGSVQASSGLAVVRPSKDAAHSGMHVRTQTKH